MAQTAALPKRGEINSAHTWDAASVFPADEAWEAEMAAVTDELAGLDRFRGRLGEGPQTLAE